MYAYFCHNSIVNLIQLRCYGVMRNIICAFGMPLACGILIASFAVQGIEMQQMDGFQLQSVLSHSVLIHVNL